MNLVGKEKQSSLWSWHVLGSSKGGCAPAVPHGQCCSRKGHLYGLVRGLMFYLNTQVVSECCLALRVPDPLHPFY